MNELDEVSNKKIVDKKLSEDEQKPGKRGRSRDRDFTDAESPRKIRKKLPETDTKMKKDLDVQSSTSMSNDASNASSNMLSSRKADDHDDVETAEKSSDVNTPTNANSKNEEEPVTDEKAGEKSEIAQLESEFDGEFVDFLDETFHDDNTNVMDFEEFRYSKIVDVERESKFTKIWVKDPGTNTTAAVLCYDFWKDIKVETDDVVSIKAKKQSGYWVVDNDDGFVIIKPHNLITGTAIVGSNFCLRQGVLQYFFRGVGALPHASTRDPSMTIGTLVHEVLQKTLKTKACLIPQIGKIVDDVMSSQGAIQQLYESNISQRDCRMQLKAFVPQIFKFVNRYILGNDLNAGKSFDQNFKGKIERIREIEENVWMPSLGIRGKMDVTVDVTADLERKIMPLEVKTGRASFSCEHRGQIVLYNMMLRYTGQKVDSGLLLYIRENVMQEIKYKHNDERDLILLRNSYANYVTKTPQYEEIKRDDGEIEKVWKPMELPEPINHSFACSRCEYNILCAVFAEKDPEIELSESHPVKRIYNDAMSYLTKEHVDYIMKWITMVRLEDCAKIADTKIGHLWTLKPREREEKGTCVCNLKVSEKVIEENNRYLHTFERNDSNEEFSLSDFTLADFTDGEYIVVSTDKRINVSAGYLKNKSKDKIELLLDRNIVRQSPNATFHLDKYPYMATYTLTLANVATLLCNSDITNKLRAIIIDKRPAIFGEKLSKSVAEIGADILFRLNKYQRKAVLKVLTANDYMLIKGMPGTGKTQTLVALIELLVKTGRSVLVTAHTHSAVDNILLKLNEKGIDFMRLGSAARINPAIIHKSEDALTANCKTPEELDELYNSKKVVAVTCLAASHVLLVKRIFDVCLVDESTQVMQSIVLKPIYSAGKFVLVGDPEQLAPVIRSLEARKLGMNETLFDRLHSENNTVTLKLQYRMNRKIMSVANEMTYKGTMKAANDEVASATIGIKDKMVLESCERWVSKALSMDLEDSVVVLNTGETFGLTSQFDVTERCKNEDRRFRNVFEAAILVRLVTALLKGGLDMSSIGIICPYTSQVELMRNLCPEIETNTVDQYQGRDKEIIIYSCTRSVPRSYYEPHEMDILHDRNRLNVAVTRAKHKLIIIGDKMILEQHYEPFNRLFSVLKNDIVDLEPGRDDFSWENLLQLIK